MSREARLKATVGAMQPQAIDYTKYAKARVASRAREFHVTTDDAAWALAFLSVPAEVRGEILGSPLAVSMIRLKYADQLRRDSGRSEGARTFQVATGRAPAVRPRDSLFHRALDLLMHHHGGLDAADQVTMRAVAAAALFEWLNDACPKCRGVLRTWQKAEPCHVCWPDPKVHERSEDGYKPGTRRMTSSPRPGCQKCGGMGRIFPEAKVSNGMRCLKCKSSGRKAFESKHRWKLVTDYLRHEKVRTLRYENFTNHWSKRLYAFLDVLHRIDRQIGIGLDYGLEPGPRLDESTL